MSATLIISDELAAALEDKRKQVGLPTIDAAAEALLTDALSADIGDADDLGLSEDALRALIAEGDASGQVAPWDARAARDEVLRRFAAKDAG